MQMMALRLAVAFALLMTCLAQYAAPGYYGQFCLGNQFHRSRIEIFVFGLHLET